MKTMPLIILSILSIAQVWGQENRVIGRVLHAKTREPIHMASAFLAGTSVGAASNEDGTFTFTGFQDGVYDLTVSSIGFETLSLAVDFMATDVFQQEILLHERPIQLTEIEVTTNANDRKGNLEIFEKKFLGTTANARKCRLLNSESLHLYLDPETNILYASSDAPLVIENRALGYRVTYHLTHFEYHRNPRALYRFGVSKFDTLKPANASELKRWKEQRHEAFSGSVMHFMRAMVRDRLSENGFDVRRIVEVPEKIGSPIPDRSRIKEDSLRDKHQWTRPGFADSVASRRVTGAELILPGNRTIVGYEGKLAVTYVRERPEPAYPFNLGKPVGKKQESKISFRGAGIRVNPDGTFTDPELVFVTGYWSWAESVAELLPYDYKESSHLTP